MSFPLLCVFAVSLAIVSLRTDMYVALGAGYAKGGMALSGQPLSRNNLTSYLIRFPSLGATTVGVACAEGATACLGSCVLTSYSP